MNLQIIIHILFSITLSFVLQLVFHELGHLLGGLITGWRLIYLQIYKIIIVKEGYRISIKKVNSINFQCIMCPKRSYTNPYIYTLGGCIVNLILTLIGLLALINWIDNMIAFIYSWSFFVMGTGFLFMNGIPRVKRVCNDMACYILLKRDPLTRRCHNAQLQAAYFLYKGCSYFQIGERMLCLPADEAYNDILAYHALLEYYYYLDIGDWEKQRQALEKIKDEAKLSKNTIAYLTIERIYISLIDKINKKLHLSDEDGLAVNYVPQDAQDELRDMEDLEKRLNEIYIKGDVHMERVRGLLDTYKAWVCVKRDGGIVTGGMLPKWREI